MEFKEIDNLLKKYFDGDSSLEEEALIWRFLKERKDLPIKYERIRSILAFYQSESHKTSKLTFETISAKKDKKRSIGRIFYFAVAASITLLFGILYFNNTADEKPVYAYINGEPIENQEIAYKEAQKALMLVSKNLNDGAQNVNHLSELNKVVEKISTNN